MGYYFFGDVPTLGSVGYYFGGFIREEVCSEGIELRVRIVFWGEASPETVVEQAIHVLLVGLGGADALETAFPLAHLRQILVEEPVAVVINRVES